MEVGGEGSSSSSSKGNDNNDKNKNNLLERKARSQKDQPLKCPRCNSSNTKFCYYNNYSLSEPRYFCKSCRRYWTERKNKRSSSLSSSAYDKKINGSDQTPKINHHHDHDQDHLNLTIFPPTTNHHHFPSSTTFSHLSGSFMAPPPLRFNDGGGFGLHEPIKPSLSFSDLERLESDDGGYVNFHQNHHHEDQDEDEDQDQDQTAVMFPIEDLKQSKSK